MSARRVVDTIEATRLAMTRNVGDVITKEITARSPFNLAVVTVLKVERVD